jgi:hypothetical protein
MMFWALGQRNEAFYDSAKPESQHMAGGGVWNMICDSVELTDEQKKKVRIFLGQLMDVFSVRIYSSHESFFDCVIRVLSMCIIVYSIFPVH